MLDLNMIIITRVHQFISYHIKLGPRPIMLKFLYTHYAFEHYSKNSPIIFRAEQ